MRHLGKRAFALLLALMLCLSLLPSAVGDGGDDGGDDPAGTIEYLPEPETPGSDDNPEEHTEEGTIEALPPEGDEAQALVSGQCGDHLTWSLDADGTLTISGTGDMWDWTRTEYAWPSTPWQATVSRISSIRIEPGVTGIGSYAFYGCQNMAEISIAETVTLIGEGAFDSCSGLVSLTIPEGVTSIESSAFESCVRMRSIWLPTSLSRIGDQMLSRCTALTDIYYSGTMVEWKALEADYDPYQVTIHCTDGDLSPEDPAKCGDNLIWDLDYNGTLTISGSGNMWDFYSGHAPWYSRRSEIKELRLMSGVTSIGNYAFFFCEQLSSVTLPEGLIRVGDSAFLFCHSLWALTLPKTVTSIGSSAFGGSFLCSFVIPEGVSRIENNTFSNCPYLTSVIIPESVTEIGEAAFNDCPILSDVKLPERLTSIGFGAFANGYIWPAGLESITIPASVSRIGIGAFANCGLKEIYFQGSAPLFESNTNDVPEYLYLFYRVTATAYYPAADPSWSEEIRQNYGGDITWEPYLLTGGTLSLGDATACAGRSFTADLTLNENPGIMALSCQLDYDASAMEFVGAEDGVLTGWTVNVQRNALVWDGDSEQTDTGCLLKLKFRLKEDAVPGETSIGLTNLNVGNYKEDNLIFQVRPGKVTVLVHRPGDANGDGKVNVNDLIRLRKYLVGAEKRIIEGNADVNADEVIDIVDLVRLRKYLALVEGVILE